MLLHFHNPICASNQPYSLQSFPLLHPRFTCLFHPYFLTKSSLQSTLIHSSSIPKMFSYLSHLANLDCIKGRMSYGVLWGFWISPSFLKVMGSDYRAHNHWFLITQVSENWCIAGSSLWWRCLQLEWQTIQFNLSHTLNLLQLLP